MKSIHIMFKNLWRSLDLIFCFSERARQAVMSSRLSGCPVDLMYDGGMQVQAADIAPAFQTGIPQGTKGSEFAVGRLNVENGGFTVLQGPREYDRDKDAWYERSSDRWDLRRPKDLWLSGDDYVNAMYKAAEVVRSRTAEGAKRPA